MDTDRNMEKYWEWLCSIPELYRTRQEILLRCFETPRAVYDAPEAELLHLQVRGCSWINRVLEYRKKVSPEDAARRRSASGSRFVSCEHPDYPRRLLPLRNKPYGLFYRGALPPEDAKAVAIVGARMCTPAGRGMAESLARIVALHGGVIISGAAYGIDGAAQWAALEAGGVSFAVLGCGTDCCYPPSHRLLFERLTGSGGLLSEFPDGTRPLGRHFPMRNRIISGISDAVVVVEARKRSGSLITAEFAAEQGRHVMAVPGRPDDLLSEGCNELISDGADLILSAESFEKRLFPDYKKKKIKLPDIQALAPAEKLVYSSLGLHAKSFWELEAATALPFSNLSDSLFSLELKGLVKETEQNYFVKI